MSWRRFFRRRYWDAERAREIDALVPVADVDPDEDPIDHDDMLAPLEEENNETVEVELLAALAGPIEQLNATPLTPCLQRLVYNLVAPLPVPTP